LDTGQRLGHSPNMLFDEAWHRRAYPGIAALVEAGTFPSAFDAWCRGGCCERSPHWLFDEPEYRRRNPDLTDAFLRRNGLVNGYDHYLWRGNAEGRVAHPLFDPAVYRAALSAEEAGAAAADGPFWHFLRRLHRGEPEVPASVYFDPVWYQKRYPAVREAVSGHVWRWAIEHYSCNAAPTEFDPSPAFSEAYYLGRYEDAAGMVRRGEIRNGFAHFLRHGVAESRSPCQSVDLAWYASQEAVRRDLEQGLAGDAFAHWLTIGRPAGLASAPAMDGPANVMTDAPAEVQAGAPADIQAGAPGAGPITERTANALFRRRARTLAVLHARTGLDFTTSGAAPLSVILTPRDGFDLTMMTLGSLRANDPGEIDLVLIDRGSSDETRDIQRYARGMTYFRFDSDIGLLPARNAALQFATGEAVLFLDNAAELSPGAIASAMRRLAEDQAIAAVGGMILGPDEAVWEAGGVMAPDGSIAPDGRGASSLAPEVNVARDTAFCAGVFLLARRAVLNALEGFDAEFAAGDYAAADLCVRMWRAGHRVAYDPAVVVRHLDSGGVTPGDEIARMRQMLANRHAAYLAERPLADRSPAFGRVLDPARRRVLFIEDTVPLRRIGSGFVRSNDIVRTMAAMGYAVTVYPINGCRFDPAAVYADLPAEVEVMHDHAFDGFTGFLAERRDYFDLIWVARTHNIATVRAALEREYGEDGGPPPVILDTEAIASVREARQAALDGAPFDLDAAIRHELRDAPFCRTVVAINEAEAALARETGFSDVEVLGHSRTIDPTPRAFSDRDGMLFVGAIHRMDSPNYDSLCWFIDEVLPLIGREMTWRTRLTVVGYTGENVVLDRFRDHPRVTLRGPVTDLRPLYDSHRVFVAPTRFAAGVPYKVHEAASFGLPVVATELLRGQLGWADGVELLAADADDAAGFAGRVIALQRDETLWARLRDAALERLRLENNATDYRAALEAILGPARRPAG
jgi:GT2 family glycosyltransferase